MISNDRDQGLNFVDLMLLDKNEPIIVLYRCQHVILVTLIR